MLHCAFPIVCSQGRGISRLQGQRIFFAVVIGLSYWACLPAHAFWGKRGVSGLSGSWCSWSERGIPACLAYCDWLHFPIPCLQKGSSVLEGWWQREFLHWAACYDEVSLARIAVDILAHGLLPRGFLDHIACLWVPPIRCFCLPWYLLAGERSLGSGRKIQCFP